MLITVGSSPFLPDFFFAGSAGFSGSCSGTGRTQGFLFNFPGFNGFHRGGGGASPCCPGFNLFRELRLFLHLAFGCFRGLLALSFCAFSASCGTSSGPALPALHVSPRLLPGSSSTGFFRDLLPGFLFGRLRGFYRGLLRTGAPFFFCGFWAGASLSSFFINSNLDSPRCISGSLQM